MNALDTIKSMVGNSSELKVGYLSDVHMNRSLFFSVKYLYGYEYNTISIHNKEYKYTSAIKYNNFFIEIIHYNILQDNYVIKIYQVKNNDDSSDMTNNYMLQPNELEELIIFIEDKINLSRCDFDPLGILNVK